ncbi:ATP-NAD kinase [Halostella sp. JP-L12]|uniref:NAD(+)/NADH kinase n=1 Tax=Halostella TaxID=1843185 RepID=UPI000EF7F7D8|nr:MULTISPECIES: NAD(+)/NADH kinase [Halostella]NHN47375.1 ATP-NAD kinase [Halostella sp. JP-L12]
MAVETVVAVVGATADRIADAVSAAGGEPVVGEDAVRHASTSEVDLAVADGGDALVDLVRAGVDVPVLPVEAGRGVRSVPQAAVDDAVADAVAGEYREAVRPVLSVSVDGDTAVRAAFDVTLVTTEPARISEYAVRTADRRVAEFRADGVVVATPAGSRGYANDAGGPVLDPTTSVLAATPIAPFVTDADDWVLPETDLTLSVERNEGDVSLVVDGRDEGQVPHHTPVDVSRTADLRLAVVDDSRSLY